MEKGLLKRPSPIVAFLNRLAQLEIVGMVARGDPVQVKAASNSGGGALEIRADDSIPAPDADRNRWGLLLKLPLYSEAKISRWRTQIASAACMVRQDRDR